MQIEVPAARKHRISLTPLIDVVFILLVFFMLASSVSSWQQLVINTPELEAPERSDAVFRIIRLTKSGQMLFEGKPLALPTLVTKLTALKRLHPELALVIEPEQGVALQQLVTVMEALGNSGLDRLSLRNPVDKTEANQ